MSVDPKTLQRTKSGSAGLLHLLVVRWLALTMGQIAQLLIGIASLVLLARHLTPAMLGSWIAVTALTATLAPLAGLGYGNILIRETARDSERFALCWGATLVAFLVSALALCVLLMVCGPLLLPKQSLVILPMIAVTDLVFRRFVAIVGVACQAREDFAGVNRLGFINVAGSLAAILIWITRGDAELRTLAGLYMLANLTVALLSCGWWLRMPRPRFSLAAVSVWREALFFILSPYSISLRENAGAIMLSQLSMVGVLGQFGAAFRIVATAMLPISSLMLMTYPEFFRRGGASTHSVRQYVSRLALPVLIGGAVLAMLLYACAPLLPFVMGEGYRPAIAIVQVLAVLVPLKALQFVFADAITGMDRQRLRVGLQIAAALLCLGLNLIWSPTSGWRGAAAAAVISETLLALCFLLAVRRTSRSPAV